MRENELTQEENEQLLNSLFPEGFAGQDVKDTLIPEGWENSSLKRIFHPTVQQRYEEMVRQRKWMKKLSKFLSGSENSSNNKQDEPQIPSFAEFKNSFEPGPVEPEEDIVELLALCVYDIFSRENDVIAPDGRIAHFGSWRGTGGFLATWIEKNHDIDKSYSYLDFYMGTSLVSHRTELRPVYQIIYKRLKENGYDWKYTFPRVHLVNVSKPKKPQNPQDYDPEQAITNEQNRREREKEKEELEKEFEMVHQKNIEGALEGDPPSIVQAYTDIYGHFPVGWPPE